MVIIKLKKKHTLNVLRPSLFCKVVKTEFPKCRVTHRKHVLTFLNLLLLCFMFPPTSQVLICRCGLFSRHITVLKLDIAKGKSYMKHEVSVAERCLLFLYRVTMQSKERIVSFPGHTREKLFLSQRFFISSSQIEESGFHRKFCLNID